MNLLKSFATVGGWTGASRILGFVRDILIARYLGVGTVADAWFAAFAFPNLFRRLFGEGAFNAAFVPLFSRQLEENGEAAAKRFAEEVLGVLLLVLVVLTILAQMAMPLLTYVIAPGFADDPEKFDTTTLFARIAFPYLMFMSLAAMLSGVLNSLRRYAIAAAAPVLLNVTLIVFIIYVTPHVETPGHALVWGVALAGALQFLLLLWGCARQGMALRLPRPHITPGVRRLVQLGIPGAIAGGITQINLFIGHAIASFEESARAVLGFADRIYQLPLGMIGIAMGVVLLPEITRRLRGGDEAGALDSQNRSLEFSMGLTVPAAVALAVIPLPIVSVLFQGGAFTADAAIKVALAVQIFAFGLPAFVLIKIFSPSFFAREDTKTPLYFSMVNAGLNVVASLILFFPLGLGYLGIAIATSLAGWANAVLLGVRLYQLGHFRADDRLLAKMPRILLASGLMGTVLWGASIWLAPGFDGDFAMRWASLIGLVASGLAAYGAAAMAVGALTVSELRGALSRSD